MDLTVLLIAALSVLLGAMAQGVVGLGVGLVVGPVLTLLDPALMPGSALILGLAMPLLTLTSEWRHVHWRNAGWLIGARTLTTPLGVVLVALVPASAIGVLVGSGVLLAIGLTVWRLDVRVSRRNLLIAGAVGGVSGTAASISGPPAAIVLQHQQGPRLRATLAAFFSVGSAVSLAALHIGGRLTRDQILYGVTWVPVLLIGFGLAIPLQRRVHGSRLRTALLVVAAAGALSAIVKSLL